MSACSAERSAAERALSASRQIKMESLHYTQHTVGYKDVVKIFIDSEARLNIANTWGITPEDWAREIGLWPIY